MGYADFITELSADYLSVKNSPMPIINSWMIFMQQL